MSGYSFAAIYKAPVPPGPGPVNPDVPIDDPDDPDNINYTISGTSIKPFVPFTVTVTGSSNKAKGNGGNLQADIDYEILNDAGWQSGQRVFSLGTRVCDSERSNAQFSWLIRGRAPSTVTLAYDAGTMTPDLEKDNLTIGESFGFTITYSAHENCYASHLADFGASYWWEAQKNGAWERTTRIATNTSSFAEGVLTGNATVGNLAGYDKIRLCVSYAGRETAYAEATLVASEVTITLGDSGLHCFGPYTSLQIESDSLELMTAAFYRGNNTTNDITDTNGTPIAFTFSGTTWTGNIQAATGATAGTVILKVMYNGEVVASEDIIISTDLLGSTIAAPSRIMQGESIEATGEISNEDYPDISRIPANTVQLVVDSGASAYNEAGEDSVDLTYLPSTAGTYTLSLIDSRDGTVLDTCDVDVSSIFAALKEAIEERYKGKNSNTTVESIDIGILVTHAVNAMTGYLKTDIGSDGSYTLYNNSNTGIVLENFDGTENEWALDTYQKIKACKTRIGSWTAEGISKEGSGSTTRAMGWDEDIEDYVWEETESVAINRAILSCESAYDASESSAGAYGSPSAYTYSYKYTDTPGYMAGGIMVKKAFTKMRYKCSSGTLEKNFSRTVKWNVRAKAYSSVFSKHGHSIPNENTYGYILGEQSAGKNEDFPFTSWTADSLDTVTDWDSTNKGYILDNIKSVITYGFKHK